jgi:hypothetical protein
LVRFLNKNVVDVMSIIESMLLNVTAYTRSDLSLSLLLMPLLMEENTTFFDGMRLTTMIIVSECLTFPGPSSNRSTMPFPHKAYLVNIFHCCCGYFIVERGAMTGRYGAAKRKYVFPGLHSKRKENIAKDLTAVICANLPKTLPKSHADQYSSRSARKGGAARLASHPEISEPALLERGGWSSQSKNKDTYVDTNVALSLPGAMAITDHQNVHGDVYPALLAWMGPPATLAFIKELVMSDIVSGKHVTVCNFMPTLHSPLNAFIINTEFCEDGQMRPFFEHCIASVIMYHPYVKAELSYENLLVKATSEAAKRAKISDPSLPGVTDTESVLIE